MTVEEFIAEWNSPDEFITAHTSGSTGKPKEIRLAKELVANSAIRTINFFGINSKSHLHLILSPDYIAGKMMIVRSLISGAHLTWEKPSNTPELTSEPIDFIAAVPSQMPAILAGKSRSLDDAIYIIGGSAIPYSIRKMIVDSEINGYETYGMTETASHVALRKVSINPAAPFKLLEGISGKCSSDSTLHISGKDFSLQTNDIVRFISEDEFVLLGRKDNAIVCGAIKLHPEMIEMKIDGIMRESGVGGVYAVAGKRDPRWGQIPVLVIEESDYSEGLFAHISSKPEWKQLQYSRPKKMCILRKIPLTANGKIDRGNLNILLDGLSQ